MIESDYSNQIYCQVLSEGLESNHLSSESDLVVKAKQLIGESGKHQLSPLSSILGQIGEAKIHRQFSIKPLSLNEDTVFTSVENTMDSDQLLTAFRTDQEALNGKYNKKFDNWSYRYSLFNLIHTYGSRLAYSDQSICDYSLFDRNRLIAGLYRCLGESDLEEKESFLLVKGAVTGIQTFIYNNIKAEQIEEAKGSSKELRGRSFFVALLNNTLAEYIIESLELEQANIIFVGGGHFTLIVPNTKEIGRKLGEMNEKITLGLRDYIGPQLSLILSSQECTEEMLSKQQMGDTYTKLNDKLEQEKQRKSQTYLSKIFQLRKLVRPFTDTKTIGRTAPKTDGMLEITMPEGKSLGLSSSKHNILQSLSFLGKFLLIPRSGGIDEILDFIKDYGSQITGDGGRLKVILFNKPDFVDVLKKANGDLSHIAFGFRFLGNYAPAEIKNGKKKKKQADIIPFDQLAELDLKESTSLEFPQLAAMRMDIDDLGAIFFKGLGEQVSFQRIVSLSRELQLFFGGYFNKIAQNNKQYITYSGGDDAFVIGNWKTTLHFAYKMNRAFRRFTCNNPHIGISAGIFMCNPTYPVSRFAYDAEDLEKKSKKYGTDEEGRNAKKDAITVYNHTLQWEAFNSMMEFTKDLEDVTEVDRMNSSIVEGQKLRRSVVRRFLNVIQAIKRGEDFDRYRNIAMLHTLLARQGLGNKRLYETADKNDKVARIVKRLLQENDANLEQFQHYVIPIHYVLNATRKRSRIMEKA